MNSFWSSRSLARRHASAGASVIALSLALALAPLAAAQSRSSGLQVTPDAKRVLVSKDVGPERWAISLNEDGTVTGNVFRPDGSPPAFLWCEELVERATDSEIVVACYGATPCTAAPCSAGAWRFLADVPLPLSFFEPDQVEPTATPAPTSTPRPSAGASPATPSPATPSPGTPSPSVSSSPDDGDVRCCLPDDQGPECEDRTPSECAERGGTSLGPGSCLPNPCT